MATPWDAETYDRTSKPQQRWANEVIARLIGSSAMRPCSTSAAEPAA
jgi:hypothetical protein